MEEARELLSKHLYLQGGDGLGISDGKVYNACLDAIMEALTIPVVVKSFTAEEVVNELKENETLDDAISFYNNQK